ncbi:NADP-dependent oxidoreductase [Antribacter sp. KLBMP9083]|uniref:NADP-dependent oxidoreductase n=1 Tax=Antribacter soli TaxID=2910976 RepID=A0AA41QFP6_9MICO|nr:NADP-dependent oxidoreductase [Antribacter soli]MCF4122614.1 NADP-dependent oxidoreductase [Antribacter soli]
MKVVVLGAFGRAPEVAELEVPTPGAGEVRVRVRAASINGFDVAVVNGYLNGVMEHRFPVVLGKDFAGTIDAVGEGVEEYTVGDRVFGVVVKDFLGDGSFGEYVTVPASVGIAKLPDEIAFTEAAALGVAGSAAVDSFDAAGIGAGTTVLISGATGGVGQQTLQLAAKAGAVVIATAHTAEEIEKVVGLGAGHTVDHTGDVIAQLGELYPDGVDVVLHLAGDPAALASVVKAGGVLVSTLVQDPGQVSADGIRVVPIYAQASTATLERLARSHAEQHTTVTVQRVYDLDETPDALGHFAAGTLGKLVVSID